VRSSGLKPKTLSFHPAATGEGKVGRVKSFEPLVDASSSGAPHGWMAVAGYRDTPLKYGGRWPVSDSGQGEHRCPRSREGSHPDRSSCV